MTVFRDLKNNKQNKNKKIKNQGKFQNFEMTMTIGK